MVDITGCVFQGIMLDFSPPSVWDLFKEVQNLNLIKEDNSLFIYSAKCTSIIITDCKTVARLIEGEIIIEGNKKLAAVNLTRCLSELLNSNKSQTIKAFYNHKPIFTFGQEGYIFYQLPSDKELVDYLYDAVKLVILM